MLVLERLRSDHADAIFSFEVENRAYFTSTISDRGDAYFEHFAENHRASLAEQESGACSYYVLVDENHVVLGRFNLYELKDGTAEVGYRVGEHVAGQGVATDALRALCSIATTELSLRTLTARTRDENVASQRVLEKCGFAVVESTEVAGRPGRLYRLALVPTHN